MILLIAPLLCGCFVAINGQPVVDETESSSQCIWNNEEYMRQSFERTGRPTLQLLMQMKQSIDSISDQLMTSKSRTQKDVDDRQCLASALTERCIPLLMQQNVDGSDFFNRSWAEFKVGFNDARGNYWLGNDLLSHLTQKGFYKLRFDLQSRVNHNWYYAEYSTFIVQPEKSNYTLRVSGYSGNAGQDAFIYHNGMMFTTYDRDNDHHASNCAVSTGGGFWHKACAFVEVNTIRGYWGDFSWEGLPGGIKLQSSRMWIMCR